MLNNFNKSILYQDVAYFICIVFNYKNTALKTTTPEFLGTDLTPVKYPYILEYSLILLIMQYKDR